MKGPTLELIPGGLYGASSAMDDAFAALVRDRDDDDLCTPAWLWAVIGSIAPIALDPCSNPWAQPAPARLDRDSRPDGLAADWAELANVPIGARGLVYVNPPYARGHLIAWAYKCAEEARRGVEIVALTPVAPTTAWWRLARYSCDALGYLDRRVQFEGGPMRQGMIDSAVWYWGAHAGQFLEAFRAIADVRVFDAPRAPLPLERPPAPPPRAPKTPKRKPTGRGRVEPRVELAAKGERARGVARKTGKPGPKRTKGAIVAGPGFVSVQACPLCLHTRCGSSCSCSCKGKRPGPAKVRRPLRKGAP